MRAWNAAQDGSESTDCRMPSITRCDTLKGMRQLVIVGAQAAGFIFCVSGQAERAASAEAAR